MVFVIHDFGSWINEDSQRFREGDSMLLEIGTGLFQVPIESRLEVALRHSMRIHGPPGFATAEVLVVIALNYSQVSLDPLIAWNDRSLHGASLL
jgi:hypothetical protein